MLNVNFDHFVEMVKFLNRINVYIIIKSISSILRILNRFISIIDLYGKVKDCNIRRRQNRCICS